MYNEGDRWRVITKIYDFKISMSIEDKDKSGSSVENEK
jgi:hypothetical protein